MFFEGSEKKIELITASTHGSLRALDSDFWTQIVSLAKADIISVIHNQHCDAYLLSESSLFVWDNRIVMLTCGLSTLIDSLLAMLEHIGVDHVAFVSYQRKNEYLAHLQVSTFADDIARLRQYIPGTACRIGHLDSHHHFIFTSDTPCLLTVQDNTSELLMYHISGPVAEYLTSTEQTVEQICALLGLSKLFEGFDYDAHLFTPLGFSVNGIKDEHYFTIHITPQEQSSYVSVETNVDVNSPDNPIASQLLALLQPISWDTIGFNTPVIASAKPKNICLAHCSYPIEPDYHVHFGHFQQLDSEVLSPEFM
ncbi:adenosylmethionine decarboxylase [Shewanella algicola]|uniref:adenosylmethionine decarboxylase n=1 Tax=Shewanella algicola TaxID=640633 RepID=UPI002494B645|nr:adenosylmethionine decarboxylase [Shewanella algicola]